MQNSFNNIQPNKARRYDLDWLRVIAFGLLIYFHAAVAFIPSGLPLTHNDSSSIIIELFVTFSHQWRLALLFFVSGCGVSFSLAKRNKSQFINERIKRLLIPLVFGICVLVPPIVFMEKSFLGQDVGSFMQFYPTFFTNGVYPIGNLSWHHFWFIAYLFLFCVVGWPVLSYLQSKDGYRTILDLSNKYTDTRYGIYLLILPLLIFELPLRPIFPGFPDLIHDWANIFMWFTIFIGGFIFAKTPQLIDQACKLRYSSLLLAIIATSLLFVFFWHPHPINLSPLVNGETDVLRYIVFSIIRISNIWFWILTCLGFASKYLNHSSASLSYLNQAVYPFFCIHLGVLVAVEIYILPLDWSITTKYTVITTLTVLLVLISYEMIKRIKLARVLFGIKEI